MSAAIALILALQAAANPAGASAAATRHAAAARHTHRACAAPRPGRAACQAIKLVAGSLPGSERAAAAAPPTLSRASAGPAVTYESPFPGYLTPAELHEAYALPTETGESPSQTIALVDAYDDPSVEADLGVFDQQFGLPACTSANGCFREINQEGNPGPLPATNGEWASEISIDVQMAHAICQSCHILLVEANSEKFTDLGTAVNAAASAGASEISNSYAGPERAAYAGYGTSYYEHPGVVVTAAGGDCGYLNQACAGEPAAANFPASSPALIAVGGTKLSQEGGVWSSSVWDESGSGCSGVFSAPVWQTDVSDFSATGCGTGRSVADVAAVGDPETGVDIYDSTPEGSEPTGWGVWGGTSVGTPIIAGEYALAGGAHGIVDPAATLYSHEGQPESLYDVVSGSNGTCSGAISCDAAVGYDGPSGGGSPIGLGAFAAPPAPVEIAPPSISGSAEQGQTLTVARGQWTNSPTSIGDQWEDCDSTGESCSAITGATGRRYTLTASDVGSTIRVQETASNAAGAGAPALSAPTVQVVSDAPAIDGFSPLKGITGSSVTIEGSGFGAAEAVQFGALAASFTVLSSSEIEAIVPDGAIPARISVSGPIDSAKSASNFTPTLSVTGFLPATTKPGKIVTITGIGFNRSSQVSFGGIAAAHVTFVTRHKLKATVPAGAAAGAITVTNTAGQVGTVSSAGSFTP